MTQTAVATRSASPETTNRNLAIPTSRQPLNDKLTALLRSNEMPTLGPKSAEALRQWVSSRPTLPTATMDDVERQVTVLSAGLKERAGTTTKDASLKFELFYRVLSDIPLVDLLKGVDDLLRVTTFMPAPAELRAAAYRYTARREHAYFRARDLVRHHERHYSAPVADEDRVKPEEIDAIKAQVAARFTSERDLPEVDAGRNGAATCDDEWDKEEGR